MEEDEVEDAVGSPQADRGSHDRPGQPLPAARSVLQVRRSGLQLLSPVEITMEGVGAKAIGLLAMPVQWVPAFFVIHADAAAYQDDSDSLSKSCDTALKQSGLDLSRDLIVRSSGVAETMQERGRLVSEHCSASELSQVVRRMATGIDKSISTPVHWVVQERFRSVRRGHLSNERRLAYEPRDWVVEVELEGDKPGYTSSIAFRKWRDGAATPVSELWCTSEAQITLRLKQVSLWALAVGRRMHFEWVWNGSRVWIVQGDFAENSIGVDPRSLRPASVPKVQPASLSLFTLASAEHLAKYGKLRNAKIYTEIGYAMPAFYILDDQAVIESILQGVVTEALEHDLTELTKRSLIIRTDGSSIPSQKREMLPRSDELRSAADALSWLTNEFTPRVLDAGLRSAGLCLVAHHFVPSVASAWARAEPGKRMVRVESLWGLPEGLYWYSHDTFEVDIESQRFTKRLRYKGTFVAGDAHGRWVPNKTLAPADWRRSVKRARWIHEMAATTRKIADYERYPVAVMWLVDNHPRATAHQVLPWFHSKSELSEQPKAAPRRKLTTARDHRIANRHDWETLRASVAAGRHIERVIVAPVDPDLIRNPQFAEELATLAAKHQIVIELAGGILSHAYYVLSRHGAHVECIDLFGADPEIREFNKLVRDKIPASIQDRGEGVDVVQLKGDAYMVALRQKLVEEAYEALDAHGGDELIGELADVQEVVRAVCKALQIPFENVEAEREEKRARRGGFDRGVMLKKTSTPHSLSPEKSSRDRLDLQDGSRLVERPAISRPEEIPTSSPYRRPDLRTVGDQPEKLFTFETELSGTAEKLVKLTTKFVMPIDRDSSRRFTLTLEFARNRAELRGTVRFRLEPEQLPIQLDDQLQLEFPQDEPVVQSKRKPEDR